MPYPTHNLSQEAAALTIMAVFLLIETCLIGGYLIDRYWRR